MSSCDLFTNAGLGNIPASGRFQVQCSLVRAETEGMSTERLDSEGVTDRERRSTRSPGDGAPSEQSEFHVVGIGASAGGLDSLERLFAHLPTDTGMAFVVLQHLSPDFKSLMDELLSRRTSLPIRRPSTGWRLPRTRSTCCRR